MSRALTYTLFNAHQVHVPTHRWRSFRPNSSSDGAVEGAACISTRGAFLGFLRGACGSRCSPRCEKVPATHHKVHLFCLLFAVMFVTPFLFAYSSALKARERWIAQSSRCSACGAWLSTDPQSTAFASLEAIDPTLPHSEDNIQW